MISRLSAYAMLVVVAGCGILTPLDGERGDLEDNRDLWERTRPADYFVVVERQCFCGVQARGPVRMRVEGNVVAWRVYVDTELDVGSDMATLFPTVDGLFDVIADALDRNAHEVRVTYDPDTGVPEEIWIDYEENAVDEELGFAVTYPGAM